MRPSVSLLAVVSFALLGRPLAAQIATPATPPPNPAQAANAAALAAEGVFTGLQSGYYDAATKAAVKAYQAGHALTVNGVADRATRSALHLVW